MFWFLLACGSMEKDSTEETADLCKSDLEAGTFVTITEGFEDGTEGISLVDGLLYISFPTGVVTMQADGTVGTPVVLDHALGLAPAVGGVLVADPGEFTMNGSGDDGHLWYLGSSSVVDLGSGIPNPNFVANTSWGDILVSDDTGNVIYAVKEGVVRNWISGVPSPNGMAFSPDGKTLYVASTFIADPPIWAIPVSEDGTPGIPKSLVTLPTGSAPDGLTVDANGGIWVAANLSGEIVHLDPATGAAETFATGLPNPASLAFGLSGDFDPCSLYLTSLYGDTVSRLSVGVRGLELAPAAAP